LVEHRTENPGVGGSIPPLPTNFFKINLDVGHGGASGRYDHLREIALDYAFILTQLGLVDRNPSPAAS
jgi:hypothetical protein